jgi:hypothetical protein
MECPKLRFKPKDTAINLAKEENEKFSRSTTNLSFDGISDELPKMQD